ncbi:hypothetical protein CHINAEXTREME_17205 [Halobiforma lacisalsi AJ5]|uniref:Uncharacterized protein n=1 Tax=Natronobacterium lacisalsi AJ5 TaxID=358396 RepID=M0LQB2_NATLA|nr:hypothetical protein [Halobiforma lacisalsi]APW99401.1 hypothetical protein CHINAEXTREME_17205 [Halobiforma lacisalsi AJ5]EMA35298.1 hypothetical protein C445_05578 [Halobiforma lacisalsi AJ5]
MATVNVSRATETLSSSAFLKSAVLIVGGSLGAQLATNYLRSNVYDVQIRGGDAVYALTTAFVTLAILPQQYSRPLALGMGATSVRVLLNDFDIV